MMLLKVKPIDTSRKQYGTVLVYGTILDCAGGSVVQNAAIVASNRVAYKNQRVRADKFPAR